MLLVVYRKVGLPNRWKDKVTGCSGEQGLLSASPQRWRSKRDALRAKSQTLSRCENRLLCPRWWCAGLRTWKSDKPSKNNATVGFFFFFFFFFLRGLSSFQQRHKGGSVWNIALDLSECFFLSKLSSSCSAKVKLDFFYWCLNLVRCQQMYEVK